MIFIILKNIGSKIKSNKTIISIFIIMVLLVVAIYYIEKTWNNEYFQTWWDAIRWAFITSTTIWYGDKYPITFWWQFLSMIYIFLTLWIIGDIALKITNILFVNNEKKMNWTLDTNYSNHTIIYGEPTANTYSIIRQLSNEDNFQEIVFLSNIDKIPNGIEKLQSEWIKIHFVSWDPQNNDSLKLSNIEKAKNFIILSKSTDDPDKDSLAYVMNVRIKNKYINILSEIKDDKNQELFEKAWVNNIINSSLIGHRLFVRSLTDNVNDVIYELLDNRYGKEVYQVDLDEKWEGKKLWELIQSYLKENVQIIAIRNKSDNQLYFNKDYSISEGDLLYIISEDRVEKL